MNSSLSIPGWTTTTLGVLGRWGSGGTPSRSKSEYYEGGEIPWLVIGNLNESLVTHASAFITQRGLENSSAKLLPAGTLLVAMYGSIGKTAITGIPCATNQAIAYCIPYSGISLSYLHRAIQWLKPALIALGQGGAQQNISQGILKEQEIPLAPEREQKRIADKLDTVLTRVDAVNARLARVAPILKRFRQSVLAAATSGRLTQDWRDERQLGSWQQTDVQGVALVGTGSTPLRSNPSFFAEQGTPWVTSAATGSEHITAASEFVTRAAIAAHRLKVYPAGTLLVAMYGEGKTRGQVAELDIAATINQACAAVVVDETKMLRTFVKLALQANYLQMRVLAEGGNQPNLNLSKVKGFPLPAPTIEEQAEIVRRVEILFAFADRLEARLKSAQTAANRLTPALLAKAFRGELVAQDPDDEPAAELLKRLAASQAGSGSGSTRSRKKSGTVRHTATGDLHA